MTPTECVPAVSHAIGTAAAATVATMLKAIADPLRLRMLSAIANDPGGEVCVCDLAELAEVSQPTVSHHLRVMKDTGLLTSERRGTWVYYRITPARKTAVTALLDAFAPAAVIDTPSEEVGRAETLASLNLRIERLAEELADELSHLNRDLVTAIVRESYAALVRSAKLTQHMIPLTERFARQRLADLTRDREAGVPQVLFVCVANAGRSQLAAALVNQLSNGKNIARSVGSIPAASVHPHVRSLLVDIEGDRDAASAFPKPLTDDAVRAADVVVTMGCGDACPFFPGKRYEDWKLEDPAGQGIEAARPIRDEIKRRVEALIASLQTEGEPIDQSVR